MAQLHQPAIQQQLPLEGPGSESTINNQMQILSLASVPPQGTIYSPQGTRRRVLQAEQPRQPPQWPAPKQAEKRTVPGSCEPSSTYLMGTSSGGHQCRRNQSTSKTSAISAPTPKAGTSEKEFKTWKGSCNSGCHTITRTLNGSHKFTTDTDYDGNGLRSF